MTLHDAAVLAALGDVIAKCSSDTLEYGETLEQMFVRKARRIADAMIAARSEADT